AGAIAAARGAAANAIAGGGWRTPVAGDAQFVDDDLVEFESDIRARTALALIGGAGCSHHLDEPDLDCLDFESAAEQPLRRPFDAGVAGAQPDTIVIDQSDVRECCGLQRIAVEPLHPDRAERADTAAVDLADHEGPAAVAGDPEAQADANENEHEQGQHHADGDPGPERDFSASRLVHQKACPMEI